MASTTLDEINDATGYANGTLFADAAEVTAYFTPEAQTAMFGQEAETDADTLDGWADEVIRTGHHMAPAELTHDELIARWTDAAPEDTVIVESHYSPNGGQATWTPEWVQADQDGVSGGDAEDAENGGLASYDSVKSSEDGLTLTTATTPRRGVHTYRTYRHAPAEEFAGELLAAYRGEDGRIALAELVPFGDWLEGMGLEDGSDGYRAAMAAACEELAGSYQD